MNTIWADTHGVHDELTTVAALHDWLGAVTDYRGGRDTPSRAELDATEATPEQSAAK